MTSTIAPLDDAMRRAYTLDRCIDYGCRPEDARALHEQVAAGSSWLDATCKLGGSLEAQAAQAGPDERPALLLAASACLRVGQAALEDRPQDRLTMYQRATSMFEQAVGKSAGAPAAHAQDLGQHHRAWLFRPPQVSKQPGCVVIWGGADGWCEAFHHWVPALHVHGLAVCLTELPGQGLARLLKALHLSAAFTDMVSGLFDELTNVLGASTGRFAVIGNSLGGSLALRVAANEPRIAACVTNGGSIDPLGGMSNFPRAMRRFLAMLGPDATSAAAERLMAQIDLPGAANAMNARLLCVHGGRDPLVSDNDVARLQARRPDMTLMRWDDGVHCIYNHAAERNLRVARWVAQALVT